MNPVPRWMHYWPGLAGLWGRGGWGALFLALGFAAVLDVTTLLTFVWQELLPFPVLSIVWVALVAASVAAAMRQSQAQAVEKSAQAQSSSEHLFCAAQGEYLKGHWFEAEKLLRGLLADNPRDLEARLLLATLLRRTKRFDEAIGELARLELVEGADRWRGEIDRERTQLIHATSTPAQILSEEFLNSAAAQLAKAA